MKLLTPVILPHGLALYFIGLEAGVKYDILDDYYFCFTCAAMATVMAYKIKLLEEEMQAVWGVCVALFIYLLIMFGLDRIYDFNTHTKLVYVPIGGMVTCMGYYVTRLVLRKLGRG